ncbi:MAG TPA: thiamine pyrophosphate-dependent enzyme [Caulobacteraceae bacterium]|jgi:acetolactate synthase-1/2/3 large subunit|nr:thiamine pyrophosphate-dependent enzyme [Caulobacteraceae bacterium]
MDMSGASNRRSVGRALVDQLLIQGVRRISCVPGESYLPVLDALGDTDIAITVCRQEGGAAMMADAWARATGAPGVCFVTRGPGAANAFVGVHIAQQDCNPLVLFVGQIERAARGREAWQEIDLERAFGGVAKLVVELDDPNRVGEIVSRAFHLATSGRPGPVIIGLPRDVLSMEYPGPDAPPVVPIEAGPSAVALTTLQEMLAEAQRPLAIVGGSRWDEASRAAMHSFADRFEMPVATSYRRGGLFDAEHACYAGDLGLGPNPRLIARIKAADLVLLLGGRLGEVASQQYKLLGLPDPGVRLVHVHPDPDELGRIYRPALAIPAAPRQFAPALAGLTPPAAPVWRGQSADAHRDYLEWSGTATPQPGEVNLGEVFVWLRGALEEDAVICNGAGGYAAWLHRFSRFRRLDAHIAPASATMGYGPPAAIAMKQLYPERQVISVSGDGDFLMNGQEFATMVQYGLPITNIIIDNESYGSIRLSQEREFPCRVVATDLKNPDFAAYARAFGGFGATVERTADFADAFRAAEASGQPAIIHLKVSVECMTPGASLAAVREQALASGKS